MVTMKDCMFPTQIPPLDSKPTDRLADLSPLGYLIDISGLPRPGILPTPKVHIFTLRFSTTPFFKSSVSKSWCHSKFFFFFSYFPFLVCYQISMSLISKYTQNLATFSQTEAWFKLPSLLTCITTITSNVFLTPPLLSS